MLSSQGDMVFPNHSISLSFHHTGLGKQGRYAYTHTCTTAYLHIQILHANAVSIRNLRNHYSYIPPIFMATS